MAITECRTRAGRPRATTQRDTGRLGSRFRRGPPAQPQRVQGRDGQARGRAGDRGSRENGVNGSIGIERSRAEGPDKVSGRARYSADRTSAGLTYGVFAASTVARGRIVSIDSRAAEASSGIL